MILCCSDRNYRVNKARDFIRNWDYERALIELTPFKKARDGEILFLLGECSIGKNNYPLAREHFKRAIELDSLYIDSVNQIYKILVQKSLKVDDSERAIFFFDELLMLSPRLFFEPGFLFLMGDIYYQAQNYEKAAATYEEGMKIDSTSRAARDVLARLLESYEKTNNLAKALRLVEAEYERTKSSLLLVRLGKYYFDIGLAYFHKDLTDSARLYFEKLIDRNSPQSLLDDAHFYLGELVFRAGNYAEARFYYEKVLKLNPYRKGEIVEKAKTRLDEIKSKGG